MPTSPDAQPRPLAAYFSQLPDRRIQAKCKHRFIDIVMIVVCATIAGADDFVAMEAFAKAKKDWLRERLGLELPNGIPSHDVLNRVFAAIRPTEFNACFAEWVADVTAGLKPKQIAIDGKTHCGSKKKRLTEKENTKTPKKKTKGREYQMVHMVSAWATEAGLTLGQVKTEEKSNEITAIPELLKLLDVSGALVSIDAMGCQKEIAKQIVDQKGDYLLAAKDNQPRLLEDLEAWAMKAFDQDHLGSSQNIKKEQGHGRTETRFCFVSEDVELIRDRHLWPNLRSLVCVVSHRVIDGKESDEVRYYISSRSGSAKQFQAWVRNHWSIENSCHWVLDVAFREDDHRLREGHAPANLSSVRKMALALLKKAEAKCGIKNKRLRAAWDNSFLEHILRDYIPTEDEEHTAKS
jgi:predicted transposase YbfD/YdcC